MRKCTYLVTTLPMLQLIIRNFITESINSFYWLRKREEYCPIISKNSEILIKISANVFIDKVK